MGWNSHNYTTPGNYNFELPDSMPCDIVALLQGAGGGGGKGSASYGGASGASGAIIILRFFALFNLSLTIGQGGYGGTVLSTPSGGTGGPTSIGLYSAAGGCGGDQGRQYQTLYTGGQFSYSGENSYFWGHYCGLSGQNSKAYGANGYNFTYNNSFGYFNKTGGVTTNGISYGGGGAASALANGGSNGYPGSLGSGGAGGNINQNGFNGGDGAIYLWNYTESSNSCNLSENLQTIINNLNTNINTNLNISDLNSVTTEFLRQMNEEGLLNA